MSSLRTGQSFRLVACLSTYREGSLAQGAIDSCAPLGDLVVWEGPAGDARLEDAPPTTVACPESATLYRHDGEWSSDAAKRDAMLKWCKQRWHDKPLWVVWVDGDELLINAGYLRDLVQTVMWQDEQRGASLLEPDNAPTGGIPLRVVEQSDGNICWDHSRLYRADLIAEVLVSNLIVRAVTGNELRLGRRPMHVPDLPQVIAVETLKENSEFETMHEVASMVFHLPPMPAEPFLLHRPQLRHPLRREVRLHEQEVDELERLGYPTGAGPIKVEGTVH